MSASSKFSMRSTKDGIDPVVMALSLGMVTVGERAFAVKGIAVPSRIRLKNSEQKVFYLDVEAAFSSSPLSVLET